MKSQIARFLILGGILNSWLVVGEGNPVWAADMMLKPSLSVSEEFSDNIYETSANKRSEFTTRIQPGGTFHYLSPLWEWDTKYYFEYRNYARNSTSDEFAHNADLSGKITLVDNFLFLEVSDNYHRVPLDITRDPSTVSSLFLNQTDQNIATISPYMLWRLGEKNTLKTGYRFTDTRYWGDGIDRREHVGFADLSHEVTSKLVFSAGYAFNRLESQSSQYNRHDLSGGFRYQYADKSFLFGKVGNSWLNFNNGNNTSFIFWNAGVTHDFNVVVATLESSSQISVDPNAFSTRGTSNSRTLISVDPLSVSTKETTYSGKLEKTLQRGMIGLSASYTEFENIEKGNANRLNRLLISGTGRYEVLQDLTANLSAIFERTSRLSVSDTPYRFSGSLGLSYAFKKDLILSVTYSYATYLQNLDTTAGSVDINKAVVEAKKVF